MSARSETYELQAMLERRGIVIPFDDANTLRRAQITLRAWSERECGTDNGCIERDEDTGKTYWLTYMTGRRWPIRDLATGALKRVATVCAENGLHWYHQGDPRGCALYVSRDPMDGSNYNNGVACIV